MEDKRHIGEILAERLQEIDDVGGNERFQLRELVGKKVYDAMMAKQRTSDLISRWLSAGPKTKVAATRALAIGIARHADKPELVARIEREIGDTFDLPAEKPKRTPTQREVFPTAKKSKARKEIDNQRLTGQRPVAPDLVALARGSDVAKYIRARRD
jgi:hypothetical protein